MWCCKTVRKVRNLPSKISKNLELIFRFKPHMWYTLWD